MPSSFHKTLLTYFFKSRRATGTSPENDVTGNAPSAIYSSRSRNSATNFGLFSACSFPKTPSFALDREGDPSDNIHHYNTVFVAHGSDHPPEFTSLSGSQSRGFSTESIDISLDLANAVASERFFVPPRASNSILDEASGEPATPAASDGKTSPIGDGIAVTTFSRNPFIDFRQSMQEMVEARVLEQPIDWEYLEELFLCYLKLNNPRDHVFILEAFTDLLTGLVTNSKPDSAVNGAIALKGRRRRKEMLEEKSDES